MEEREKPAIARNNVQGQLKLKGSLIPRLSLLQRVGRGREPISLLPKLSPSLAGRDLGLRLIERYSLEK